MCIFLMLFVSYEDSICKSHRLQHGDLIVISSDGLFDNVYEDEIALIISSNLIQGSGSSDTLEASIESSSSKTSKQDTGIQFDKVNSFDPGSASLNINRSKSKVHGNQNCQKVSKNVPKVLPITNERLSSICQILVERASSGKNKNPYYLKCIVFS